MFFSAPKLNLLLINSGINSANLSEQTGIDVSTIIRILNGSTTNPRPETIQSLAKYFGVDPTEFYDFEDENDSILSNNSQVITFKNTKNVLSYLLIQSGILNTSMLHKFTGIPKSNLDRILSGETQSPNIKTLEQLATFFNLKISQINGLEPINKLQKTITNNNINNLPLIKLSIVEKWQHGHFIENIEYTHTTRQIIGEKSFAILIDDKNLEPTFRNGSILIVDSNNVMEVGDFIIAKKYKIVSIFEYYNTKDNQIMCKQIGMPNVEKFDKNLLTIYGVVVQEIINKKE